MVANRPVNEEGLTVKQILCADAIAEGKKMSEAARIAGVDAKTVLNWRNTQKFMTALTRRIQERTDISGTQGVGLVPECLTVLKTIMNSPNSEDRDKIRAAATIMASANVYRERQEMEGIIAKLEERLERLAGAVTHTTAGAYHDLKSAAVDPPEDE